MVSQNNECGCNNECESVQLTVRSTGHLDSTIADNFNGIAVYSGTIKVDGVSNNPRDRQIDIAGG